MEIRHRTTKFQHETQNKTEATPTLLHCTSLGTMELKTPTNLKTTPLAKTSHKPQIRTYKTQSTAIPSITPTPKGIAYTNTTFKHGTSKNK